MSELVSILIPVFNRVGLIDSVVQSALAQTHRDIEIVVVDNASTDGTWERLQELVGSDARIRIHRNATNIGPLRNWHACIERARGRISKILWSDDLIAPTFVERCLPFLQDPETGFAYTATVIFRGDEPAPGDPVFYRVDGDKDTVFPSTRFIDGILEERDFPFSPGCALFRTEDLRKNLLIDVPNRHGSDFSMHAIGNDMLTYLLTARAYPRVAMLGEPLSYFRDHDGSISTSSGPRRLLFHYDMAKAYFVSRFLKDDPLRDVLNARLRLHLLRYGPAPYDMTKVADFYPVDGLGQVRLVPLLSAALALVTRRLARVGRPG